MSIKGKVLTTIILSLLLIVATIVIASMVSFQKEKSALQDVAATSARIAVRGSIDALRKGNMNAFSTILREIAREKKVKEFSLTDSSGKVLYSSDRGLVGKSYKELVSVAGTGQVNRIAGDSFISIIPVKTSTYCIRCHSNWQVGKVNSYFVVKYDASSLVALSRIRLTQVGIVVAVGILMMLLSAVVLNTTVGRSLEEFSRGVKEIVSGNFSFRFREGSDEMGQLGRMLNELVENLAGQILDVSRTAEKVASTTKDVTGSAETIERMAQDQLTQSQEISHATEEIAVAAEDIAVRTEEVKNAVEDMYQVVEEGKRIVEEVSEGMGKLIGTIEEVAETTSKLGKSSEEIGEIVSVISDITGQTNLLALNAAIEAARAGEHGRGFAVVADEVRKLAERTQRSTEDIRRIIENIQTEIGQSTQVISKGVEEAKEGRKVVEEIKSFFNKLREDVEKITEQMSQVAAAIEEQSSITKEMVDRTGRISDAAQKNLEEVARMKQLSMELSAIVVQLQDVVERIKRAFGG